MAVGVMRRPALFAFCTAPGGGGTGCGATSAAPQERQNFALGGFSVLHAAHFMDPLSR
jgi:hypothetical protein